MKRVVEKQTRKLAEIEPQVSLGQVEAIHDFRVALRRMRLALRLLGDSEADKLRKQAKRTAALVGSVRDLDVLMQMSRIPDEWRFSMRMEREQALSTAKAALADKSYSKWKRELTEWLAQSDEEGKEDLVTENVRSHAREVERLASATSDKEFHQLRIAVKRLRYLLEFFRKGLSPEIRREIKKLAGIQDELGLYHDRTVLEQRLALAIQAAGGLGLKSKLLGFRKTLAKSKLKHEPKESAERAQQIASLLSG